MRTYAITGLAFQSHTCILLGSTGNSPVATAGLLVKVNPPPIFDTSHGWSKYPSVGDPVAYSPAKYPIFVTHTSVAPVGVLQVAGNYTQALNGVLKIELGGTTPGTQNDQLGMFR